MKVVVALLVLLLTANAIRTTLHSAAASTTTTTTPTKTTTDVKTTVKTNGTVKTTVEAPKPCGFNDLGLVPGNKDYTFEVKTIKSGNYAESDFLVKGWKKTPPSAFFKSVGKISNFHDSFVKLGCQLATKNDLVTICGETTAKADQTYKDHFGPDIIFKCKVPKDSLVLALEYNLKAGDIKFNHTNWVYFSGLHQYKDLKDAKTVIETEGKKLAKQAKDDKLDCLGLDHALSFTPLATQQDLVEGFNSNSGSSFVKGAKANTAYPLESESSVQVLPEGTHFVVGSIFHGTTAVKSICHNLKYQESDNCKLNLA